MTTTTTTFTKLRSGDWGVRGPLAALDLGAGSSRCVTVAKKDGTVTTGRRGEDRLDRRDHGHRRYPQRPA